MTEAGKIKAALRAKKQEWTRWQDNPGKRNMGLNYLGLAQEIERVMLDPAGREKEAEAARERRAEMLAQFEAELRVLESKGHILPREAEVIALKYKPYGVTAETVQKTAKCPVSDKPVQKEEDAGGVLDRVTARNIQRNLQILGQTTLYAFLGEPPYSSIKKLLAAAEQKRRGAAAQGGKNPHATISQELAGICVSVFDSIHSKQRYDRYLKVSKYPAVSELIDEENARSQYIAPNVLLRIVNFAVLKYGIKVIEAEEYIKAYCLAYEIPLDERGVSIICPACQSRTPRGGAVCAACAQPLAGICPRCGEAYENGPAICPVCGFSIGEMAKAIGHLSDAENALIESNWSTAQRSLAYVRKYWPGHQRLGLLEKRATLLEERYASYIEQIEDCVRHRQLYAAQELIQEAEARHLRLPATHVKNVGTQIAAFEYRVEKLLAGGDKQRVASNPNIDELLRLSAEITDSMELARLLSSYPPDRPKRVAADTQGLLVNITWESSPYPNAVTYVLTRKENSPALTVYDGEVLYEGPAHSYADDSATPLKRYYYSVFSKRAGAYSRDGAESAPVVTIPEVANLRVLPLDGGAKLTWDFNPDVREVRIFRKLGGEPPQYEGDGIMLENERLDGYTDQKLKNDVEYWYFVVAVYIVDGSRVLSGGVCDSVIPRKTVAAIDELNIAPTDAEGVYMMGWNSAQHPDILLFCAAKRPALKAGDIVAVEELLTGYRRLDLEFKRADSAQFKIELSGGLYIFAASVFGRFAAVSEPRYIVNVADMEDLACDVINGNLYLSMKWPLGVTGVAVAYRFDRLPKAPDEPGATTLFCSREQYEIDDAVLLKEPEPQVYYMAVFSVFVTPDGRRAYSRGVELSVNNQPLQELFFHIGYKKKRFAESGLLDLSITSADPFTLPKAVIVGKIGRLPLGRADGLTLFELEKEMKVNGSVSMQLATNVLPPNIYVRLFLHDDSAYEKFRLLPTSPLKIT